MTSPAAHASNQPYRRTASTEGWDRTWLGILEAAWCSHHHQPSSVVETGLEQALFLGLGHASGNPTVRSVCPESAVTTAFGGRLTRSWARWSGRSPSASPIAARPRGVGWDPWPLAVARIVASLCCGTPRLRYHYDVIVSSSRRTNAIVSRCCMRPVGAGAALTGKASRPHNDGRTGV